MATFTPRFDNLVDLLEQSVQRFGHKPLFGSRKAEGWSWVTYGEFHGMVRKAATALRSHGVAQGDRVAIIANNRLEWATFAFASYALGAAYVPMYEAVSAKDWLHILRDSGSKICFVANTAIRTAIKELQPELPELKEVFCLDCGDASALLQSVTDPIPLEPQDPNTIASLIYTSGTTGPPKGVMLTHYNVAAVASGALEITPFRGEERSLSFLPWAHVFGGCLELNALLSYGAQIAICSDSTRLLEYLPEVQPTVMFAVPRVWNRMYDAVHKMIGQKPKPVQRIFELACVAKDKLRQGEPLSLPERAVLPVANKLVFKKIVDRFGGNLRFAVSGGAALSPEVGRFVDDLGITVLEGYGLTETTAGTTACTLEARRIGSVGKPFPGVEVRFIEHAEGTSPGEGELVIYGPGVMKGYYGLEQATRETFTEDGGFKTGDLGRMDADGFIYITGRVKELYKLENGKYVAPAPLEEKLQLSPFISQCVLSGADRPYNVALIVPDLPSLREWCEKHHIRGTDEELIASDAVVQLLRAEIDAHSQEFKGYETVRKFVLSVEELSPENGMLTPTLKVKRRVVAERYGKRLEALY